MSIFIISASYFSNQLITSYIEFLESKTYFLFIYHIDDLNYDLFHVGVL